MLSTFLSEVFFFGEIRDRHRYPPTSSILVYLVSDSPLVFRIQYPWPFGFESSWFCEDVLFIVTIKGSVERSLLPWAIFLIFTRNRPWKSEDHLCMLFFIEMPKETLQKSERTQTVSWLPWALVYSRDRPYNFSCMSAVSKNRRFTVESVFFVQNFVWKNYPLLLVESTSNFAWSFEPRVHKNKSMQRLISSL